MIQSITPADEREPAIDAQDWDEAMDDDMKLYPGPAQMRKET